MTESEQKANEAWCLMWSHAMPARVALDFVQDITGDRIVALHELIASASAALRRSRPDDVETSFANGLSLEICLFILTRSSLTRYQPPLYASHAFAKLRDMRERLFVVQFVGPSRNREAWLDWCCHAERTIHLVCDLAAEATS